MTSPTEVSIRRRAESMGVPPEVMCVVCARVAYVREHFGHTVVRLPREATPPAVPVRGFITVAEVAAELGVSKMTVYRLIHARELEAVQVGRTFRIRPTAVDTYLAGAVVGA